MAAAFAPVVTPDGGVPVLGVFVHLGAHYTAMIHRNGTTYHIDSLPHTSGEGQFVFIVDADLFAQYAQRHTPGQAGPRGVAVGGLYSVYYLGYDYIADEAHLGVG